MTDKMKIVDALRDASLSKNHQTFLSYLTDDIEYYYHMSARPLMVRSGYKSFFLNTT